MSFKPAAEFRDPIHGYIYLSEAERRVVDDPIFQRLRRIRQLSGAHLTYPGGQHSRFEHAIGAMYLAGVAGRSLSAKALLKEDDAQQLRLAALLHDIGHGPFSHLLEEVLAEKRGVTHEDMTKRVLEETRIRDIIEGNGFNANDMAGLALGLSPRHPQFVNDILGGGLSVDIMDYLLRDSHFTGVEYGKVDIHRVINSFEVVGGKLALDQAALYAFEALMIARYEMFRAVYFHRTVRAAEIMLMKAIDLADGCLGLTDVKDLERYLSRTDDDTLALLTGLEPGGDKRLKQAKGLATDYRDRRLLKCVFERTVHRKDRFIERIFSQKRIREELAAQIGEEAKVDPGQVHIDVPSAPSVPFTSSREALTSMIFVSMAEEGPRHQAMSIGDLPLVGAISGFFDILRVYTSPEHRAEVEGAANRFFEREGFITKISM